MDLAAVGLGLSKKLFQATMEGLEDAADHVAHTLVPKTTRGAAT